MLHKMIYDMKNMILMNQKILEIFGVLMKFQIVNEQ